MNKAHKAPSPIKTEQEFHVEQYSEGEWEIASLMETQELKIEVEGLVTQVERLALEVVDKAEAVEEMIEEPVSKWNVCRLAVKGIAFLARRAR